MDVDAVAAIVLAGLATGWVAALIAGFVRLLAAVGELRARVAELEARLPPEGSGGVLGR